MRRLLRTIFIENAALKAVSLFLAVTLFVVVHGERETQAGIDLPVVYDLTHDRVLTSDPPAAVHLVVRGPWTKLRSLDAEQIGPLTIDLARVPEGDLRLLPDMVKLPPGLTAVEFTPATIRLTFQQRITRALDVVATLDGVPAYGYRVDTAQTTPRQLLVVGPKEEVEGLSRLETLPIAIAGESATVTRSAALVPLPPHVELASGEALPQAIAVEIDIVPALAERTIADVPVQVLGLHHLVASVAPDKVQVVVHGEELRTDTVDVAALVASVDGAGLEPTGVGDHVVSLTVTGLPEGVAAVTVPASVTVTLKDATK